MSLRDAVSPYAHQKQVFQGSECDLNSIWLNLQTFSEHNDISVAFLYKVSLGRVLHDREFTVKAKQNKRETEEGKPSNFSAVNMKVAVCIQLEVQEILSSALFPWHPFPTSLTGHLTLAGESPGGSSLWAVMATTGPRPQALDAHTCCVEVGFVTNPLPSADCCPLPVPVPVQRLREVISTRLFICIADLMVLFWLMVPGYSRKSHIKGPCYQWSKNQYPLFCLFQFSSGP